MNRFCIVFIMLLFFITACFLLPQPKEITDEDKQIVLTFDDIENLNIDDFVIKKNRYEKNYTFIKSTSKSNGHLFTYGQQFLKKNGQKPDISISISIQPNINHSRQSFESKDVSFMLFKKYKKEPKFIDYGTKDIVLAVGSDSYYLSLLRGRIHYKITIYGIPITEDQVKEPLLKKLAYIEENFL